jgi:hypothetical protein
LEEGPFLCNSRVLEVKERRQRDLRGLTGDTVNEPVSGALEKVDGFVSCIEGGETQQ